MSRSIKKNPIVKDNERTSKERKQIANRTIRRKLKNTEFEIADGKAYKKLYPTWDIHDYAFRVPLSEVLEAYRNPDRFGYSYYASEECHKKYPTEEKLIAHWKKTIIGK